MHRNILIAAGGTGGHIIPAIALKTVLNGNTMHYVCGNRDIEKHIYSENSIEPEILPFSNYRTLKNVISMILSVPQMFCFIIRRRIDIVIMMGSYMSFTTGIAAVAAMKPIVLMEQDIIAGKNIRLMSVAAKLVFTAFNKPYRGINRNKQCYTGHLIGKHAETSNKDKLHLFDNNKPVVLVTGGSQGALSMYKSIYPILKNSAFNAVFIGSAVKGHFSDTENIRILPYTYDMGSLYRTADVIISRAGAMSIAEIIHACKPAIFIPLPGSADNHQKKNIQYYRKHIKHIEYINQNQIEENKIISLLGKLISMPIECNSRERDAGAIIREKLNV